jgi:hypothetical protein
MRPNLPLQLVAPRVPPRAARAAPVWHLAAVVLVAAFFVMQATTLDYGTSTNNIDHVANYRVKSGALSLRALERENLVATPSGVAETRDKWMMRFKLYSVEPDDVVTIMALAHIRPQDFRFDPGFYQYGGAYLYPLGAWYFVLARLGAVHPGPLPDLLAKPERMDAVYICGRLFVLIAFALSALVLWRTLALVTTPGIALVVLGIYLVCPATVMFSQQIKPHWYGLLWTNLAMLWMVGLFVNRRWNAARMVATGLVVGLAVGSAATFGLFAVGLWVALVIAAGRRYTDRAALVVVPAVAVAIYLATNPYQFLNWEGSTAERTRMFAEWFAVHLGPLYVGRFIVNSLLPGLGIALTAVLIGIALLRAIAPDRPGGRWLPLGVLVTIVAAGLVTSQQSLWNINIRYVPYLLPAGLLLLAVTKLPRRGVLLGAVLVLTAVQSVPLLLAYRDTDDPRHSTRRRAARWIEHTLPTGTAIRLGTATPTPYDVPPFDLSRYRINTPDAAYLVLTDSSLPQKPPPKGYSLVMRFRPRLGLDAFPLVFGFVNPTISIYHRPQPGAAQGSG